MKLVGGTSTRTAAADTLGIIWRDSETLRDLAIPRTPSGVTVWSIVGIVSWGVEMSCDVIDSTCGQTQQVSIHIIKVGLGFNFKKGFDVARSWRGLSLADSDAGVTSSSKNPSLRGRSGHVGGHSPKQDADACNGTHGSQQEGRSHCL